MKKIFKNRLALVGIIALQVVIIIFFASSFGALIEENDVRVKENSDLTYYLDVIYDGKDSNLISSSDTATCEIRSDYIYVEDKIPEGLTFKQFVETENGTIGAVKRSDGTSCAGYVVGDSAGLVYDEETRTVSFKVKNLKAGCKLTVGIVTTTPKLEGRKRVDFYNTALARENKYSTKSNTVHAFIGKEEATVYTVNYRYTGDIPENAPAAPVETSYTDGISVGVEKDPTVAGYTFSGWTTEDATVENNIFTMPASNVTFVGSFTKKEVYKVSYSVTGDAPTGYVAPKDKEYGANDDVVVDTLKEGDIVSGYKFLGWTTKNEIDLSEGIFVMPEENVELVGSFERVGYKVTYEFQGAVTPTNASTLIPEEKTYYPGDIVTVAANLADTTCTEAGDDTTRNCKFLGWYKNATFTMPEEDVVIYGEWQVQSGSFQPTIAKEIVEPKEFYSKDEEVIFKITVTNTADYEIHDVLLEENLKGAIFTEGEGYTLKNDQYASITTIPAGGSVIVNAKYIAGSEATKKYTNEVELTGALADRYHQLDNSKEYKADADFTVANIELNINKINKKNEALTGAEFELYSDSSLKNKVGTGLKFTKLKPNTTYYLKETKAPTGYILLDKTLNVQTNESGEVTIQDYDVSNVDGVATVQITNEEINILPNTGGPGNVWYILIGVLIVGASSALYIIYYKKKGKSDKK